MSHFEQRQEAAIELCSAVEKLIELGELPEFYTEFLMARVNRVRNSYGMEIKRVRRACATTTSQSE